MNHKILLIGANGQVGYELRKTLYLLGEVFALDYPEIDFGDLDTLRSKVEEVTPTVIVNAAAYTAVDNAESHANLAFRINSEAPQVLAKYASLHSIPLIHYSTDYVYDGMSAKPYGENDPTNPLNVYGSSKLKGDLCISETCKQFIVFRTSWVYGVRGNNFFLKILSLSKTKEELNIVSDQIGCPTTSRFLAQVTGYVLQKYLSLPLSEREKLSGVYNCVSNGQTSWYDFAKYFLESDPHKTFQTIKRINEIKSSDLPSSAAIRPAYSKLSVKKLEYTFCLHVPDWKVLLDLELKELKESSVFK